MKKDYAAWSGDIERAGRCTFSASGIDHIELFMWWVFYIEEVRVKRPPCECVTEGLWMDWKATHLSLFILLPEFKRRLINE